MARKKTLLPVFGEDDSYIVRLRKRLWRRYLRLHGWAPLASALGINTGTVWRFVVRGVIPPDSRLRKALGIRPRGKPRPKYMRLLWYWENALRWK